MDKFDLTGPYKQMYETIRGYAKTYSVPVRHYDRAMQKAGVLLYDAQQKGLPTESVVGKDVAAFAKKYFSTYAFKGIWRSCCQELVILWWIMLVYGVYQLFFKRVETQMTLFMVSFVLILIMNVSSYLKQKGYSIKVVNVITFFAIFLSGKLFEYPLWVSTLALVIGSGVMILMTRAKFLYY